MRLKITAALLIAMHVSFVSGVVITYARGDRDEGYHHRRGHEFHYRIGIFYLPRERYYYYDYYPQTVYYYPSDDAAFTVNRNYLAIPVIAQMASQGVPDEVIISEIQRTGSIYHLTSEIITYLKQSKVSDKVIDFMLHTAR
jgi:hypothetical protein